MGGQRMSIINACLKELAKHKRVIGSDVIATTLKVDEHQVRGALTRYARLHPHGPVERVAVGFFRWNDEARPVSGGAPVPGSAKTVEAFGGTLSAEEKRMFHEAAATVQLPVEIPAWTGIKAEPLPVRQATPPHVCDFTVVKRTSEVVLLLDTDETLWAARKI